MDISMEMTAAPEAHRKKFSALDWCGLALGAFVVAYLIYQSVTKPHGVEQGGAHAEAPSLWSILPFAGLLLAIAIFPLMSATADWWERNKNRLMTSLAFAGITLTYYWVTYDAVKVTGILEHAIVGEYIPFIILLFALYVISGGICLKGDLAAHPTTNTAFLAAGALMASFLGTTGASMLLIRPLLQTNSERKHVRHTVIFFIFLVSNIGGCLLPIGDPPLFLGYLKGVPFLWTMSLWKEWAVMCGVALVVYFIWDMRAYHKEDPRDIARDETERVPLTLSGKINFVWLLGVVLAVSLVQPGKELPLIGVKAFPFLRELLMLVFVWLSVKSTSARIRKDNQFNYHAILEVAALFIGIFICMQAPIEILRDSGETLSKYLSSPHHFYWATGALSSFLDNAPTYVVFFETAAAMPHAADPTALMLADGTTILPHLLAAISLGAVFMGAMTYIGNAPNFMVKSIAEQSGVKMPSFFGYMVYSVAILVPLFIVVTMVFL